MRRGNDWTAYNSSVRHSVETEAGRKKREVVKHEERARGMPLLILQIPGGQTRSPSGFMYATGSGTVWPCTAPLDRLSYPVGRNALREWMLGGSETWREGESEREHFITPTGGNQSELRPRPEPHAADAQIECLARARCLPECLLRDDDGFSDNSSIFWGGQSGSDTRALISNASARRKNERSN